jgi:hypothetical protein
MAGTFFLLAKTLTICWAKIVGSQEVTRPFEMVGGQGSRQEVICHFFKIGLYCWLSRLPQ